MIHYLIRLIIVLTLPVCTSKADVNRDDLSEADLLNCFASVVPTVDGLVIQFKDSGQRYLMIGDGKPTRVNKYGEKVVVAPNEKLAFSFGEGALVFHPLVGNLQGIGYSLELSTARLQSDGNFLKREATMVVTKRTDGKIALKFLPPGLGSTEMNSILHAKGLELLPMNRLPIGSSISAPK